MNKSFSISATLLFASMSAGVLLTSVSTNVQAAEALEPGDSLTAALAIVDVNHRFGLDGAPPGARGVVPPAPGEAGQHWLVLYADDGRAERWLPFVVSGEATTSRPVHLTIDREAPAASIQFSGAVLDRADSVIVGPDVVTEVVGTDRSGGLRLDLLVDGQTATSTDQWSRDRDDGSYTLAVLARDGLDNQGKRDVTTVILDATPPQLRWEQLDLVAGVPPDVYDGRRTTLRIELSDAGAGIASARIGKQTLDPDQIDAPSIDIEIRGKSLDYELVDRVGNIESGSIALRADREGPRLVARRDDERVEIEDGALSVRHRLALDAEDSLSGVERACVEASVWYGECRELPVELIGITPGKYSLRLRAVDRLGNRSKLKWTLEVTQ